MSFAANYEISDLEKQHLEKIMKRVHEKTKEGILNGKGPFYAEIYDKDGNFVLGTSNSVMEDKCCVKHAEMNAVMAACAHYKNFDLSSYDLSLYVNAEPCIMCLGGIMWSGIDTVYYSVNSKDVQKLTGFDEGYKPLLWKAQFKKRGINLYGGIEESAGKASLDKYVLDGHTVYKPERQDNND